MSIRKYLKGVAVFMAVGLSVVVIGYLSTISMWLVLIPFYLTIIYVMVERFG